MRRIVLAHGILGFGDSILVPPLLHYFNGVAAHLTRRGFEVYEPTVGTVGSIATRGGQLGRFILALPLRAGEKVHVIAHSMGGLDARHALRHVPGVRDRVATLVTIGTPHQGSPVADAVAGGSGALLAECPEFLVRQLRANAAGLHDLTVAAAQQFNTATPDVSAVRLFAVAGDAARSPHQLLLFRLAAAVGRETGEINDGVVTRRSALRQGYQALPDWPTDHAGEIGWTFPPRIAIDLPVAQPSHFALYDTLVDRL